MALVGRRPRGVLERGLGVLSDPRAHALRRGCSADAQMPGAEWFAGARLNYAEHLVGLDEDRDRIAVVAQLADRGRRCELTFGELREQSPGGSAPDCSGSGLRPAIASSPTCRTSPRRWSAFIATASLGAIWATCAPEFGARSVVDRFAQIEPKRAARGRRLRLPRPLRRPARRGRGDPRARCRRSSTSCRVPYGDARAARRRRLGRAARPRPAPLEFEPVAFDHPLYVLFSSGTTGLPKAIVHGHGGQLIEHHKNQGLGWDLKPGGRLQWFSTTAWMMWNALVVGAAAALVDRDARRRPGVAGPAASSGGSPRSYRPTVMGVAPPYLMACRKAGLAARARLRPELDPRAVHRRARRCRPEGYQYVYEQLGADVVLINGSGGTDVCTGIVSGSFAQPVYEGEISGRCLGVDAHAFDAGGNEVVGELGELVITKPMPSMPVALWGDADGARYRSSYFDLLPRRLAPGRLDPIHRARQLRAHRSLGRDAQPRRRAARHGRVLRGGRGVRRGGRRARRAPRGRRAAAPASCSCSWSPRPTRRSTTSCVQRIAAALRARALAASRPRHDRRRSRRSRGR